MWQTMVTEQRNAQRTCRVQHSRAVTSNIHLLGQRKIIRTAVLGRRGLACYYILVRKCEKTNLQIPHRRMIG